MIFFKYDIQCASPESNHVKDVQYYYQDQDPLL
jgi:hypothetical protein